MKNQVTTKEINTYSTTPISEAQKIILYWITRGNIAAATPFDHKSAKDIAEKIDRKFSEAFASHEISKMYKTKLLCSNVSFNPTKGEAKGIDVIHVDKDEKFYVIEIKYTDANTSHNFHSAQKQLKKRFLYKKINQLNQVIRYIKSIPKYTSSDFIVTVEKYLEDENDIQHEKHDFIIPTAVVVTKNKIKPRKVKWLHKIQFFINEDEND